MCGIAGELRFDARERVEEHRIRNMCRVLEHRGPDDEGVHLSESIGLGSRRLSILDVENGRMPLSNENGEVWVVQNGEIYNYLELRERLVGSGHRFATRCDTESIVHLYEEEGLDFARHLNGMFAVAIWDSRRRRLVLARDRFGVKPLYYARRPGGILFASEMKALFAAGVEREIDRAALHDYLSLNYVPGPRTIVAGVSKLPPGSLLVVTPDDARVELRRYWSGVPSSAPPPELDEVALEREVLGRLRTAVRDHMVSDVPLGAFLSGGIDSSLVVALMSEASSGPVKTFSVGFAERSYDELPYARRIAERFRTDHHEIVLDPDLSRVVESLTEHFDEPFADNSAVGVYSVSQLAARHVKVVLSGDGGDEVFGGYTTYQADKLAQMYRRLPGWLGARAIPAVVNRLPTSFGKASFDFKLKRFVEGASLPPLPAHYAWKAFLSEEQKQRLYAENGNGNGHRPPRATETLFREHFDAYPTGDLINRMLYVDTQVQLVDCMLAKVDRMSMAHSLEVRVPFLDHRLVESMSALPGRFKVRGLTLKYLLKRIARKILPPEVLRRPKAGFTIPISRWLAGELQEMMRDELSAERIGSTGVFNPEAVAQMIDDHCRGRRDFGRSLWNLWMFCRWHDRYARSP